MENEKIISLLLRFGIAPESRANFAKEFDPDSDLIRWANEQGLYLVGIDVSLTELRRKEFIKEDYYESEKINQFRERRMAKRIIEYDNKRTVNRPNVAIVDVDHILRKSAIHQVLRGARLNYVMINEI